VPYRTFVLSQTYPGRTQQVKQQIVEMTLNGSGVRDIARVLHVSSTTVIQELKKTAHLKPVNQKLLQWLKPESVEVDIVRVEEPQEAGVEKSELDEMWSYVGKRAIPGGCGMLSTGAGITGFWTTSDEVFLQLKKLLEPFGIHRYCTGWGAYERHLPTELHEVGKPNQRKHLRNTHESND